MNNPNQHFFQAFFNGQPQNAQMQQQIPEYILHNEAVLEVINNWEFVKDLMKRKSEGKLQQVDQLEQHWHNFLVGNNININLYNNEEEFHNAFWKIPVI